MLVDNGWGVAGAIAASPAMCVAQGGDVERRRCVWRCPEEGDLTALPNPLGCVGPADVRVPRPAMQAQDLGRCLR